MTFTRDTDQASGTPACAGFRAARTASKKLAAVIILKSGVQIRAEVESLSVDTGPDGQVTGVRTTTNGTADSQLAFLDHREIAAITAEFTPDPMYQDAAVPAVICKKCDRTRHRPQSNKQCASGTCQHTCEPSELETCKHAWTVRYSENSRQRERSFVSLDDAKQFRLELLAAQKHPPRART